MIMIKLTNSLTFQFACLLVYHIKPHKIKTKVLTLMTQRNQSVCDINYQVLDNIKKKLSTIRLHMKETNHKVSSNKSDREQSYSSHSPKGLSYEFLSVVV